MMAKDGSGVFEEKKSPGVLLGPFCISCIVREKRWKCSPGVLLEAGVHSLSKLLHPGIREVKIHKTETARILCAGEMMIGEDKKAKQMHAACTLKSL